MKLPRRDGRGGQRQRDIRDDEQREQVEQSRIVQDHSKAQLEQVFRDRVGKAAGAWPSFRVTRFLVTFHFDVCE